MILRLDKDQLFPGDTAALSSSEIAGYCHCYFVLLGCYSLIRRISRQTNSIWFLSETKLNCLLATYYSKNMGLTNDSHVLRLSAQSLRPVNNHNHCYHCWLKVESSCAWACAHICNSCEQGGVCKLLHLNPCLVIEFRHSELHGRQRHCRQFRDEVSRQVQG